MRSKLRGPVVKRPELRTTFSNATRPRESLLAELLLVDREFRTQRGESVSRQRYQERFPEYSTIIDGLEFATIAERRSGRPTGRCNLAAPVAGAIIGHFELLAELGSGASGTVWKARDTRLRRLVAIKIPRHEMLSGPERERFLREGQACAQLRHPNIVAVHEVGNDDGRVFIVAEFIDGMNLREWLTDHKPTPREAAELAAQIAEALHHAARARHHPPRSKAGERADGSRRTTAHCRLRPGKMGDGHAGMTVEGHILGTPAYMSPEQARGDAGLVDRRADVYSLAPCYTRCSPVGRPSKAMWPRSSTR